MPDQHSSADNPFRMASTLQHGVPRFYWRQFSSTDSDSMIWAYDRRDPSRGVHHTTIRSIDSSNTLHSSSQGKQKGKWENKAAKHLASVVSMDAVQLNVLLGDSSASGEAIRTFLADFCLTLMISSHAVRDSAEAVNEAEIQRRYDEQVVQDAWLNDFRRFMPSDSQWAVDALKVNAGESPVDWWRRFHVSHETDPRMMETLRDGNWILKVCPEGRFFITSDIAVVPFGESPSSLLIPLSRNRLVFSTQHPC